MCVCVDLSYERNSCFERDSDINTFTYICTV